MRPNAAGRYFLAVNARLCIPRSAATGVLLALVAVLGIVHPSAAQTTVAQAEVCPEGRISRIDIDNGGLGPPGQSPTGIVGWGFRMANHLHVRTRPGFIRGELLFEEGDCFDPLLATDSPRLLERHSFIANARVLVQDDSVGGKVVRVETRDQWSTKGDLGITYDEGLNLESFRFTEQNFLGRGLFVEAARYQRLEQRSKSFSLSVPSVFQRTSASFRIASAPDGTAFSEAVDHPFAGDVGRVSAREAFSSYPALFAYATDGAEGYSHVLVAMRVQALEISAAARAGDPGSSLVLGGSLTRQSYLPEEAQVAYEGKFDERFAPPGPLVESVGRQSASGAVTRLSVHAGIRRYSYETIEGLDAVRDEQLASLGFFLGGTVGKSVPVLMPSGAVALHDFYGRVHGSWGLLTGPLLLHGGLTAESRHEMGEWKDLLAEAEFVTYVRGIPGQILFLRASGAGGWRTQLPYQLTLGGREGVRSLGNDRFPGGRQALFVVEDRITFPRMPQNAFDLGATLFADLGRVWPGDVPFGTDSGWKAAAGFGLRIAFPAGSRNVWRPDIVFPVGPGAQGSPIFRVTFELNRLRAGFTTPDAVRSHRLGLGPDSF